MLGGPDLTPAIIFMAMMVFAVLLFGLIRLLLGLLYSRVVCRYAFMRDKFRRLQASGAPLIRKYGTWGLILFVVLPIPGTGVVGGTILSWLMGLRWDASFLAIIPASIISNGLTTLGIWGLMHLFHG
ncbi:MAG: small multi-drug export protein [Chloroflexi bacterium]|nr:small multi-drug export protein [Chloroflexota bacterium]